MTVPSLDSTEHPIVRVTFGAELSLEDLGEHRAQFQAMFDKLGPALVIAEVDAWKLSDISPVTRKRLAQDADYFAERRAFIAEYVVIRSPILRTVYAAYAWIRARKNYPMRVFATRQDAYAAARELLQLRRAV